MKIKTQSVWWILLFGLLATVSIFLFAPLGLVGFYVSALAPNGSAWIGGFYSLGLSLAILTMSGLSFMRGMLRFKIGLGVLAAAEGGISFAAFWQKAGEAGLVDMVSVLGLLGIVAIQETVIFLCGSGVFATINQIKNPLAGNANGIANGKSGKTGGADGMPPASQLPARGNYGEFKARHSVQALSAKQIVAEFGVPVRTAYNWLAKYDRDAERVAAQQKAKPLGFGPKE